MFRSYIITALRNLVKNKLNASINIIGLSVAFTCCVLLFLMVYYEFSFDNFHKNEDQLFKVYSIKYAPDGDKKSTSMGYPVAPVLKTELPAIVKSTAIMPGGGGISYKKKEIEKSIKLVDNDFFSMFSFRILSGNTTEPLADRNNTVLSKSTADALFGSENPIGKTVKVKIGNTWDNLIVSSVIEDAPENSSIKYDILARIELNGNYAQFQNNWNAQHHPVYVQIAKNASQAGVERNLRTIVKKYLVGDNSNYQGYRKDSNGDMLALRLAPLSSLHFNDDIGSGNAVSKVYLYTLILISVVVMAIACFNFINLSVAFAFTRAKEIGVRKVNGASKNQIFLHLWLESFLLCLVALIISIAAALFLLRSFNGLFSENLHFTTLFQPAFVLYTIFGMILVSFLAGGYPAWLISRFKTVEVLKGKFSFNKSVFLRNGLITFQFVMASLLICSTFIIYHQFQFLRYTPLGYQQESVISIPVKKSENSQQYIRQLRQKFASQPQVIYISASSANIGIGQDMNQSTNSATFKYKGKPIETDILLVDNDFLKTLGIKPVVGRDFSNSYPSDTSSTIINILITESVAKEFAVKNAYGLSFYPGGGSTGPQFNIIGVVPDFHLYSLRQKVTPVTMMMARNVPLNYLLVKVKTNNPLQTMNMVSEAYKEIEPDNNIGASYLSENTQRWYEKEKRLSAIFTCSAGIAIVLSCLGLFAIVSLVMQQRRKEIGMRKILGASFFQINALLVKGFVKLVFISFLIATPVTWYFLNKWLQTFAYRVNINWWIFPVAGIVLIIIAILTVSFQTVKASVANPVKNLKAD
jgi:putative ABC transport system permease protein